MTLTLAYSTQKRKALLLPSLVSPKKNPVAGSLETPFSNTKAYKALASFLLQPELPDYTLQTFRSVHRRLFPQNEHAVHVPCYILERIIYSNKMPPPRHLPWNISLSPTCIIVASGDSMVDVLLRYHEDLSQKATTGLRKKRLFLYSKKGKSFVHRGYTTSISGREGTRTPLAAAGELQLSPFGSTTGQ